MCAANQEKENMFAGARHIDSRTASVVGSVQGFTLSQSNGTLSSDREPVKIAFQILMERAKWSKAGNQKRSALYFRN